jgi:hypothetical protein
MLHLSFVDILKMRGSIEPDRRTRRPTFISTTPIAIISTLADVRDMGREVKLSDASAHPIRLNGAAANDFETSRANSMKTLVTGLRIGFSGSSFRPAKEDSENQLASP